MAYPNKDTIVYLATHGLTEIVDCECVASRPPQEVAQATKLFKGPEDLIIRC